MLGAARPAAELEHACPGGRRLVGRPPASAEPARPRPRPERDRAGPAAASSSRSASQSEGSTRNIPASSRNATVSERLGQLGAATPRRLASCSDSELRTAVSAPLPCTPEVCALRLLCSPCPKRTDEPLVAIVEIPKGSSNKCEWDEELGAIKLDRLLFASLGYPTDYGFSRDTLAADGDPLDVMIVVSEPTFPGCHIEVKPVALFRMRDEKSGGRQDPLRAVLGPQLEPRGEARGSADDAARRDLALLLDLQDARVEGRQGRRLVPARGGARSRSSGRKRFREQQEFLVQPQSGATGEPGSRLSGCW